MPGRLHRFGTVPALALLAAACFGAWPTAAALARPTASPAAAVRHCGRGSFQEYPWFNIKATGTTCAVARRLIRTLLSHPAGQP